MVKEGWKMVMGKDWGETSGRGAREGPEDALWCVVVSAWLGIGWVGQEGEKVW
jgi:hypothetical protein